MLVGDKHGLWKDSPTNYRSKLLKSNRVLQCAFCGFDDIRALVVHHIDEDRKNNVLKNLVWLCHNCHYLVHEGKTI